MKDIEEDGEMCLGTAQGEKKKKKSKDGEEIESFLHREALR